MFYTCYNWQDQIRNKDEKWNIWQDHLNKRKWEDDTRRLINNEKTINMI